LSLVLARTGLLVLLLLRRGFALPVVLRRNVGMYLTHHSFPLSLVGELSEENVSPSGCAGCRRRILHDAWMTLLNE
jgi:hypothetical protein